MHANLPERLCNQDSWEPMVSIAMTVYNHAPFLSKAINSVLSQKTTFEFEIIIGDDASTDNTKEILISFQKQYPEKIRLILQENNVGVLMNVYEIMTSCKGKYIALLEGDDFWSYNEKLETQIQFLESNSRYSACFHDSRIICSEDKINSDPARYHNDFRLYSQFNRYTNHFEAPSVIERNIIPTASFVFRRHDNLLDFFNHFADVQYSLIWAFEIYLALRGPFYYFNEPWSVYREHPNGVSKQVPMREFKESNISIIKTFLQDKKVFHKQSFYRALASEYKQILYHPDIAATGRTEYLGLLYRYCLYSFRSFRYGLTNLLNFRKNQKVRCAE